MQFRRLGFASVLVALVTTGCADLAAPDPIRSEPASAPVLAISDGTTLEPAAPYLPPGYYKTAWSAAVYLVDQSQRWLVPDWDTFTRCTGGRGSLIRTTSAVEQLRLAGTIPSVRTNPVLYSGAPIQLSGNPVVHHVSGCMKMGITTPTVYQGIYGDLNWGRIRFVTASQFYGLPTTTRNAVSPTFSEGTLIQGSTDEVRWVLRNGASLGIPSPCHLTSHGRSFAEVRRVSDVVMNAYPRVGILHPNGLACFSTAVSQRVDQDVDGLRYKLSVNGQTDGVDLVINKIHLDIVYPVQILLGQVCPSVQVYSYRTKVFETAPVGCKVLSFAGGTVSLDLFARGSDIPWYVARQNNGLVVRVQYNHSGLTGGGDCPGRAPDEIGTVSCGVAELRMVLK